MKVFFESGFWGHYGYDHAGKEIQIQQNFCWSGKKCYIPAIYICGKGIVLDLCIEGEPEQIQNFMEKWGEIEDRRLSKEDHEKITQEYPLNLTFRSGLQVNGKELRQSRGAGITWVPENVLPESMDMSPEAKEVAEYYGLDLTKGWGIQRLSFPWKGKKVKQLQDINLVLEQPPVSLFGMRFPTPAKGESLTIKHPVTGAEHILTVQEVVQEELHVPFYAQKGTEFPEHYTVMSYTLMPDISDRNFTIRDCGESDEPRVKMGAGTSGSIGIIGGADGPTAVILTKKESGILHAAHSAFRFEPVDKIEWQVIFREKLVEDIKIKLI